jgi:hypothetical protein
MTVVILAGVCAASLAWLGWLIHVAPLYDEEEWKVVEL